MSEAVRVMIEHGKKKRVVASAFDWPGWDRNTKLGGDVLLVLDTYRSRFAKVAELAGYGEEFASLGDLEVVEEVEGIGMTDYYGPKVGVKVPLETRDDPEALLAYRDAFADAIRDHHTSGQPARSWARYGALGFEVGP